MTDSSAFLGASYATTTAQLACSCTLGISQ